MDATQLVQQLSLPCLLVDAALQIRAVSAGLARKLGNRLSNRLPFSSLAPLDERIVQAAIHALQNQSEHIVHEVNVSVERPATPLLVDLHLHPLHGEELLFVQLDFAKLNAAQPNALVRQMTRAFAHEIANPLGGLRGTAQLLQRLNPELTEYTEVLIRESDRIKDLLERLRGQQVGSKRMINVHEPVEQAVRLISAQFPQIPLLRDYDPSLPELEADATALTQALLNLLLNAAHAKAQQIRLSTRVEHRVRLGSQQLRTAIRIDVSDDGSGVPEHLRETLFLPLVTGRASGSGFGLATTLAIAEEHGGGLRYRSHPGDTCFSLFLPLPHDGVPR